MMPYRITYAARQDALSVEARLDGEHRGYGTAFTLAFGRAVTAVVANPRAYPPTSDGPRRYETREHYIKRFKYRVIYAILNNTVVFVAVHHASRRPGSWRHRTRGLN